MFSTPSLTARVITSFAWVSLCLLWSVSTTSDYWLLMLGLIVPAILLCTHSAWGVFMFIIDALKAAFTAPGEPEYAHTIDGVRAAALSINNWASRHFAAALSMVFMLVIFFTHSDFWLIVGLVVIPVVTSWPAIVKRFRAWRDQPV